MTLFAVTGLTLAVYGEDAPGTRYEKYKHGRGVCGLVAVKSGAAVFRFADGSQKTLCAGEAALFSDDCAYVEETWGSDPFVHYTLNFSAVNARAVIGDALYDTPRDFEEFLARCEQVRQLFCSGAPYDGMRAVGRLYDLLADFLEAKAALRIGMPTYRALLPAVRQIDERYAEPITVSSLSRLCMMSETHFRRAFKEIIGVSPIEYLLEVRMKRAEELLLQTGKSVREIAQACGFKDVEHFCRSFKSRTGMTALVMRKSESEKR